MSGVLRHRLLIASNRGPVSFERADDGTLVSHRGGGGLVTALGGLAHHHDVTWVAHAMSDADRDAAAEAGGDALEATTPDAASYRLRLVGAPDETYDLFYNTIANPLLWFVQHRLYGFGLEPTIDRDTYRAFDAYRRVNRRIADAIADASMAVDDGSAPAVMVHDYQLFLVPGLVRERLGDAVIHFFLHIPWPAPGAWRCLPRRWLREMVVSLLACDIVGVQTVTDITGFLLTVESLHEIGAAVDHHAGTVRWQGRTIEVRSYPISVEVGQFQAHAQTDEVQALRGLIQELRPEGGSLIVRVDRTDPSKNIVRGFEAYRLLLREHPELHGRVAMFCQLDPSRQGIDVYARYAHSIERAAAAVNREFSTHEWTPLSVNLNSDFSAAVAAYTEYDVLFVNPVADGMNLVSKEGPLVNERGGVVVLSREAGSYAELGPHVVALNPFDIADQADALHRAIAMLPPERVRRAEALREQVSSHDLRRWIDAQIVDVDRIAAQRVRS